MLNWRSIDVARVEQACDRVAKALLTPASNTKDQAVSVAKNDDAAAGEETVEQQEQEQEQELQQQDQDLYPPFVSEACGSFPVRSSIGLIQPQHQSTSKSASNNSSSSSSSSSTIIYDADICFEIPEDLCDTKDIENGSYLDKRDQMMAAAFRRIQSNLVAADRALPKQQQQSALKASKATLEFQPGSGNQKRNIKVYFYSAVSGLFTIVTIYCRPRHAGSVNSAKGILTKKFSNSVSGFYGQLVVEDLIMARLAKHHADVNQRSPAFAIASQLLRRWACGAAGLVSNAVVSGASTAPASLLHGGLNLFTIVTAPMLMLLAEGTIAPSSNVDSMIRAVWIYWSKFANVTGISTNTTSTNNNTDAAPTNNINNNPHFSLHIPSEPHLNIFHRLIANTTTSGSSSNTTNYIDSLVAVGEAAAGALKIGGSIEKLLSPVSALGSSVLERFDAVIRAPIEISNQVGKSKFHQNELVQRTLCGQLQAKLKQALASRANSVVVGCTRVASHHESSSSTSPFELVVAVEFSGEPAARSRLFKGPIIDDKKGCSEFENLWGSDHVTTRQFADGSINKCVVLPHPVGDKIGNSRFDFADPCSGVRAVTDGVEVLVTRHLYVVNKDIESQMKQQQQQQQQQSNQDAAASKPIPFAQLASSSSSSSFQLCAGAELLSALFQLDATSSTPRDAEPYSATLRADAVESIKEKLNEIAETSLPCKITNIEFVSPSERGTDPYPPLPHVSILSSSSQQQQTAASCWLSNSSTLSPIHSVIQIEDRKNKIPDNLEAITQLKSVLLAQLAKGFESSISGGEYSVQVSRSFADVLHHKSGFIFRLTVLFEREILVLRQVGRDAEAANLSRALIWTQRHAEFMRSTILAQFASAAGACRLLRRWICSMCLGDYIPNEVSELLIAYVYLSKPRLSSKPFCTAHTAFLAALRLIASFPFETNPLVFPEVDSDRAYLVWREEVRRQQQQNDSSNGKSIGSSGNKVPSVAQRAMFIAAPYTEPDHSPFTELTPRRGIVQTLKRCAAMAVASYFSNPIFPFHNIFSVDTSSAFTFSLPSTDSAAERFSVNPFSCSSSSITTRVIPKIATLNDSEIKQLLSKTVETNAVTSTVKTLRKQFRDRCMIFYDEYNAASGVNGIEFGNFSTYNKNNKVSSLPHEMYNAVSNMGVMAQPVKQQQQQPKQKNMNKNNNNDKKAVKTTEGKQVTAVAGKKKDKKQDNKNKDNKNKEEEKQKSKEINDSTTSAPQAEEKPKIQKEEKKKNNKNKSAEQVKPQQEKPTAATTTKKVPIEKKQQPKKTVEKKQQKPATAASAPASKPAAAAAATTTSNKPGTVEKAKLEMKKKKAKTSKQ